MTEIFEQKPLLEKDKGFWESVTYLARYIVLKLNLQSMATR